MTEGNFTDVDYEEVNPEMTYTAVQVAKIIQEDISTIRSWCSEKGFEKELDIKRVNGRRIYNAKDIENLKFIKTLRQKGMPIKQIKGYISKKGFQYREYDSGLISPEDPMGFDVLADRILEKSNAQMESFLKKIIQYNEEFKNELLSEQKRINEEFRDEILEQHEVLLQENKKDIEDFNKKALEKINTHNSDLKKELNNFIEETIAEQTKIINQTLEKSNKDNEELSKKRDLALIEELHNRMKINKEIAIESENIQQKQSFWSKLFKK